MNKTKRPCYLHRCLFRLRKSCRSSGPLFPRIRVTPPPAPPRLIRTLPDITPGTGVRTVLLPHPDTKCKAASGRGKRQAETRQARYTLNLRDKKAYWETAKVRQSKLSTTSFCNSAKPAYLLFRLSFPTLSSYLSVDPSLSIPNTVPPPPATYLTFTPLYLTSNPLPSPNKTTPKT